MRRKRRIRNKQIRSPTNSGYSEGGASLQKDSLRTWQPKRLSSKSDIDANLVTLRNRAADQSINTPIGSAAIVTSVMQSVGAGLKLFPRISYKRLGLTAEEAREWCRNTAAEFDIWAGTAECDLHRRNNFYDLQNIAYATYLTDGDSFALFRRKKATPLSPYSLRIQLIEGNRVSNPIGASMAETISNYGVETINPDNGNHIISGVEVDRDGAMTAFWVSNKVPGDLVNVGDYPVWQRVEAFGKLTGMPNILQICHDTRAEQYRGVPYLAPVLENLKEISRYCSAELTSAIIRSFLSVFFINTTGSSSLSDMLPSTYEGDEEDNGTIDTKTYKLGPGTLNSLPKGVDVKTVDSANAQSAYDSYMTHLEKGIAAGVNIPYEVLFKNFNSSYAASRAALLQARDEFKTRRQWFASDFCQPVYENWLVEAIALGRIQAPGFFEDPKIRRAWSKAEWFGPSMSILDPVKDVNGSALRVTYGLSTREREAAEMTSSDFEENLEQLAYEQSQIDKYNLRLGNPEVLAGKIEEEGSDTNGK